MESAQSSTATQIPQSFQELIQHEYQEYIPLIQITVLLHSLALRQGISVNLLFRKYYIKMNKKRQTKSLCTFISSLDQFGHPVSLLSKQHDSRYKTSIGGAASLLMMVLIGIYFLFDIIQVFSRKGSKLTYQEDSRNLAIENDFEVRMTASNFDIAIHVANFSGGSSPIFDEETYFNVQFTTRRVKSENGRSSQIINPLKLIPCEEGRFNQTKEEMNQNGLNEYRCPEKDFEIPLSGNFAATNIQFFRAIVDYCDQSILNLTNPGKICKTKSQIDQMLKDVAINIYILASTFDTKEYNQSPIKDSLRYYNYKLMAGNSQIYRTRLRESKAILEDSLLSSSLYEERNFYDLVLDYQQLVERSQTNPLLSFNLVLDDKFPTITRTVKNIQDTLASVGGLMGTICALFSVLIGCIQETLYYSDIITNFFKEGKQVQGQSAAKVVKITQNMSDKSIVEFFCVSIEGGIIQSSSFFIWRGLFQ